MALIKCPECGKEFSEHAKNCPNCGYSPSTEKVKDTVQKTGRGLKNIGVVILILVLTGLVQYILIGVLGIQYPKGTHIFFSMAIVGLLSWGAKSLGLFGKKDA